MLVPLVLLAVLSLAGGWIGIPKALGGGDQFAHFLDPVVNPAPSFERTRITMDVQGVQRAAALSTPQLARGQRDQERMFSMLSVVMAAIGWFFADLLYRRKPGLADRLVERVSGVYSVLVHKYWIDQIYTAVIVAPLLFVTRYLLWGVADRGISTVVAAWRHAVCAVWGRLSSGCSRETSVPTPGGWRLAPRPCS